jgi:polysaccharide export outer membrane protein
LQAIARAGGIRISGYEASITLKRDGRTQTVPFDQIIANDAANIFLSSGDVVYVSREPRTFLALGAFAASDFSGVAGRIEFEARSLTLMDAIGKARGLSDARANPGAAFVFRFEKRELLSRLGYPIDDKAGQFVPTIYKVDLSDPASFFMAGQFRVRDKDILYVTNAVTVDLTKFFNFVGTITGPVVQGAATWSLLTAPSSIVATPVPATVTAK